MKKGVSKSAYLQYKAYTCPACGYTEKMPDFKKIKAMNALLDDMSKIVQFQIKTVSKIISKHLPQDSTVDNKYKFMVRIKDCSDESIFKMIDAYINKEECSRGHGFLYLAAMIKNNEANKENIKKMERKKYGKPAPYVDLLKEDL